MAEDIIIPFIVHCWNYITGKWEARRVRTMSPAQLEVWKQRQLAKIRRDALEMAKQHSAKSLATRGENRQDLARTYEVLLRARRGSQVSQNLLQDMDITGLDLSKVTIDDIDIRQEHIETARGDRRTKLPAPLQAPERWMRNMSGHRPRLGAGRMYHPAGD